ncbi:MAG TPA: hypothetical protein VFX60_17655 [Micromonospora sp.]|nr:hypothetical protein [Micromonospora sp.]
MSADGPRLRLPVNLRVTPDSAGGLRSDEVRAAVADAVAAACARFPLSALGLLPSDVTTVAVGAARSGTGPEVPEALLTAAEQGATDGAARAGFRSRATARGPVRVADLPSEPFDPARVRCTPTGMTYEIPFFDGGTTRVPLRDDAGVRPTPRLPRAGEIVSVAEAIEIAWRWHVYRHGGWAFDRELPGYNGLIRLPSGQVMRCYLFLHDIRAVGPDGAPVPGSFSYRIDPDGGYYEVVILGFRSRPVTAGLHRTPDYGASGSWRIEGDVIPIVFVTQDVLAASDGATGGDDADEGLDALPDLRADRRTGSGSGAADRTGGGNGAGVSGDPLPPGGSGRALESGAGSDRARLDTYDPKNAPHGARAAWPSAPPVPHRLADLLGLAKDLTTCQPFYVEPDVSRLTDVRNLAGRMRALAAALDMPECGYLGTFAIHCAQVLTLHAHGVGVAGARSPVRSNVTVRADASGNNGYVDVRPGASPDLEWLKRLAGLARELRRFAADVVDTYGYSQNVGMVGVDEDSLPYYGGWAFRFWHEFGRALRLGYETIFTETCRLLLLQQLRSSADGIAGRRDPAMFPTVVEDLRMKLNVLGDVVLWPTVLLETIEHAERVYMSSGTVREVLSVPETISFDDMTMTLPPPIDSTPRRVLDRVADGRIERRGRERVVSLDGVTYTAAALRDMVNKRRAVLNASDPIFLQVPDLERLVRLDEGDPAQLERYLRDLFKEMADANQKMTERATDAEDGGYFALEASQYIRREGGRDARGLRYSLQGIHQLADELLTPHVGDDWYYSAGVNQALDHEADKDALLQFASTFGIIVLGLLCAPLGAVAAAAITGAVSLGFAYHDIVDAQRQTDLYHALEDPEVFQHWQDVQLAQLMAAISVAFSVFDVVAVGKGARALASAALEGLKVTEKQGARAVVRLAATEVRERVLRNLTEEMLQRAVRQAVHEAIVVAVLNELLPHVIKPVLVPWIRRQAQEHGTDIAAEVNAALGPLATGGTP